MTLLVGLRRKLLIALVLGFVVTLGLALFGDVAHLLSALAAFDWAFLPFAFALTLLNYSLRFVKWQYYLRVIGARGVGILPSLGIFCSGLAMVVTPGKVGEWLKSYLLHRAVGTPVSVSAPIVVAERLTDGLAMLGLAAGGIVAYGYGGPALVAMLALALAVIGLSRWRWLAERLLERAASLPVVGSRAKHLWEFYESAYALCSPGNLVLAVGLGLISWFAECAAFYLILLGLGLPPSPVLLFQATFVLATATMLGSISLLPGGLAVTEGSIAGLLLLLGATESHTTAAAATLLIRFATLWFGVGLGVLALGWVVRWLGRREAAS